MANEPWLTPTQARRRRRERARFKLIEATRLANPAAPIAAATDIDRKPLPDRARNEVNHHPAYFEPKLSKEF
jgi:hypothetical protein